MAHECPECGLTCHCGGDIDDLLLDENPNCRHCICRTCGETFNDCVCEDWPEFDEVTAAGGAK